MIGLEKITSKIIADAEADAARVIADADARCREISAEYAERSEKIHATLQADAEKEANDIISRAKSTAAMDKRNIMMAARSRLVDDAFAEAKSKLLSMSDKDYTEFSVKLLSAAFIEQINTERLNRETYGETDLPDIEVYEVRMNASDRAKYGKSIISGTRNILAGKVGRDILDKLVLSNSDADIEGGIILKYGDVEINCSFEMLLGTLRSELEAEVCRILFG